jgi:hypothetical protein
MPRSLSRVAVVVWMDGHDVLARDAAHGLDHGVQRLLAK